jgi:hypothetical protein
MNARPKPKKESMFVQVPSPEGTVDFHDVTAHLGKKMPFANPKAICWMRVGESAVAFSYLLLTKRALSTLIERELEIRKGPMTRLEKRAGEVHAETPLTSADLVIEIGPAGESRHCFKLTRDKNNVLELEHDGEDTVLELPRSAVQATLVTYSDVARRPVAIGFIGFPGKPGSSETVRRMASKILFGLSQLAQVRMLLGIETVSIPSAPRSLPKVVRRAEDRATAVMPVWFFTDDEEPQLAASGDLGIEVDLEQANAATGRILFEFTPDAALAEHFETYRQIVDQTVSTLLREKLGDEEMRRITADIVLGEVVTGTVEQLREALGSLSGGLDFTTKMYQVHGA